MCGVMAKNRRDINRRALAGWYSRTIDAFLEFCIFYGRLPRYFKVWEWRLHQDTSLGGNEHFEWTEVTHMEADDQVRMDALMAGSTLDSQR